LAPDYDERLWCNIEHLAAVFFAQTNVATVGRMPRTVEYLGPARPDRNIIEREQMLQEPAWDKLKVTKPSDIPGVKYNYRWLTNLVKFQLYDRFSELRESLPGSAWYSGLHYPQSTFGINYSDSLAPPDLSSRSSVATPTSCSPRTRFAGWFNGFPGRPPRTNRSGKDWPGAEMGAVERRGVARGGDRRRITE